MPWCDHCQDHVDKDHYDQPMQSFDGSWYPDGEHGVGPEYGYYGELLGKAQAYDQSVEKYPELAEKYAEVQSPPATASKPQSS